MGSIEDSGNGQSEPLWMGAAEGAVDAGGRVSNRDSTPTPFRQA
jgi:hypothetical protein